jgi:hypothetical protein
VAQAAEVQSICRSGEQPNYISPSGDVSGELRKDEQESYLAACMAIAMGRSLENEVFPTDSRPWVRLLHSRSLARVGRYTESFREFHTAIISSSQLNLRPADWFFLPSCCWDYAILWRTLFDRRLDIRNLGLANFDHRNELIGPPEFRSLHKRRPKIWDRKVTEALVRFHCCRTSGDRTGLQRLAAQFPAWGDVSASARFQEEYSRPPMKEELVELSCGPILGAGQSRSLIDPDHQRHTASWGQR